MIFLRRVWTQARATRRSAGEAARSAAKDLVGGLLGGLSLVHGPAGHHDASEEVGDHQRIRSYGDEQRHSGDRGPPVLVWS